MKRKLTTLLMLVIFLVSLFPAAIAQGENSIASGQLSTLDTATIEGVTTQDESELEEIDDTNCWSDKPAYTPGFDKGFFIWQGTCGQFWWLDWSGDTRARWRTWYRLVNGAEPTTEAPTAEDVATLENQAGTLDTATLTAGETNILTELGAVTTTESGSLTGAPVLSNIQNVRQKRTLDASGIASIDDAARPSTISPSTISSSGKIIKPRLMYPVSGRITTNGEFFDVGVRRFDGFDRIKFSNNVIEFKARVGPHFDGIFFRTTGDEVTFDLLFNGARRVQRVYIGADKENPSSIPFTLEGEPATKRVCGDNELIYNNQCVTQIGGKIISSRDVTLSTTETAPISEEGVAPSPVGIVKPLPARVPLQIKARQINQNIVKQYTNIKQKFIQAQQLQANAREKFVNAKARWNECAGSETVECAQVRQNIETGAKNFLGNSADVIIRHLEKIKNQVQTNAKLTEEEAAEMIAEIDAKIQEIEDAKAQAETAETKEDIVSAAKTINAKWKPIKSRAVYWTARLVYAKMRGVMVKMEHLEERLMRAVDKMEANGKDVSEIDPLIDEFHALLTSAEEHFDAAKENHQQYKETKEETYLDTAKQEMNSARKDLVEAHKKLKEIVRAIKGTQGTEELSEATEETPIEETEED